MNTNVIVGLVAGLIIIGAGVYYVMSGSNDAAQNSETNSETSAAPGAFKGSFASLAERGGDWKCVVDTSSQTGAGQTVASGVVYVSGDKIRAEYDVTVPTLGSMTAYMVSDGEYVYSWSSMMPQGVKTRASITESSSSAPTSGQAIDANYEYSYDCQPASANASMFVAPTDVTFMTI